MNRHEKTSRCTACIFCNGELHGFDHAKPLVGGADLLIAADGGAEYMHALNMKPHAIIGDMDSLRDDPWLNDSSIERIKFPQDKNQCDGELAVEWAFEQGCRRVLLLGTWGGRIDQALGNCALLMRYPGRLALWDDGILVLAVANGQGAVLPVPAGTAVSIISFQPGTAVRTQGLKYPLNDEPLRSATHGMSNVVVASRPSVSVTKGAVFVCMEGDEIWLNE